MFHLLEYALLSLSRRTLKSSLLTLIYTLVVAFYASVVFFTTSLKKETLAVLEDVPELWIQNIKGGRLCPIPPHFLDSLQTYPGVQSVEKRIWGYLYDAPSAGVFTIWGVDSINMHLNLVTTRFKGKLQDNQIIVGLGVLKSRNLQVGDYFSITEGKIRSFQIVGTFSAKADLLTHDLIIMSQKMARQLTGLEIDESTDIAIRITNSEEVDNIAKKISQRFSTFRVVTKAQLQATYQTLFGWRGGIFIYGSIMAIFAFLLLVWERGMGTTDDERKEVAILKGIGWEISDILKLKLLEASTISVTATISGIVLAYALVFLFDAPLLKPFLVGWSVLYPAFKLHPNIDIGSVLAIFSLSVVPYLATVLFPSWKSAITDPADNLR